MIYDLPGWHFEEITGYSSTVVCTGSACTENVEYLLKQSFKRYGLFSG
jgi:hypothetical protein